MRLVLRFDVDVSEEGLARYYEEYPAFQRDYHETPAMTIAREAIAAWDSEGLLVSGPEEPTWTEEPAVTEPSI